MKSMTGFGKSLQETDDYQVEVEMKSVNHRFLDVQVRLPRQANAFELLIRQQVKAQIQRGRVEIFVNIKEKGTGTKQVAVQWPLIQQLLDQLAPELPQQQRETLLPQLLPSLIGQADYVAVEELSGDAAVLEQLLLTAVRQAAIALDDSRSQEGQGIFEVLVRYQQDLVRLTTELAGFTTVYEADFRQRFESKLNDWLGEQVAEDRLLTEMAILLERGDIHEELDRLAIHLESLAEMLRRTVPVGRELDFLIQEMNREVNTIGSKSSPIEIKNLVVQMKTTLEKVREQIQNVE